MKGVVEFTGECSTCGGAVVHVVMCGIFCVNGLEVVQLRPETIVTKTADGESRKIGFRHDPNAEPFDEPVELWRWATRRARGSR